MALLQCEICGGKLKGRPGGIFECDSCGMQYDTAWAKEKIQEIKGTVKVEGTVQVAGTVKVDGGVNVDSLLKRGYLALEDKNWEIADQYFEKALDISPECAEIYLGKLLADLHVRTRAELSSCEYPFENNEFYKKAIRFGSNELKAELNGYLQHICINIQSGESLHSSYRRKLTRTAKMIACSRTISLGVKSDGRVLFAGRSEEYQDNVLYWHNIVDISAGSEHVVGLKFDGTVKTTGTNKYGQCGVEHWTDIIAISTHYGHTAGLKSDGTVIATDYYGPDEYYYGQCDVDNWSEIIAIGTGGEHTVGLKADGTVVAVGSRYHGCQVSDWESIVAISAGDTHTVGLKADGTVVATGNDSSKQCDVNKWKDIVAISAGAYHTVGLRADGTVVAVGDNIDGQCDVTDWRDIVAVCAGHYHTLGVQSDGTVLSTTFPERWGNEGQCKVNNWKLFDSFDTLEQEIDDSRKCWEQEAEQERKHKEEVDRRAREREEQLRREKKAALEAEKVTLEAERSSLKGLFSGMQRKKIEARLAQIETEQKELT